MTIAERYSAVIGRVADAARRSGRDPTDVRIVAVSKSFGAHHVVEAMDAGVREFGENRAQELRDKVAGVGGRDATWHFVGHLQTNKARLVVGVSALIHSIDGLGAADTVARRARALGLDQDVLIEVNVAEEATKHGVPVEGAVPLALEAAALDGVVVKGLMTMPPRATRSEDSRRYFNELARLRERLVKELPDAVELSMGMSADFDVAVEEGASIVRVGEAIFGPRGG